jgi:major membrane immunogen (membrane-anchored lipoprotein)
MSKQIRATVGALILVCLLATSCKKETFKMLQGTWQGSEYSTDDKDLSPQILEGGLTIHKSTVYVLSGDGTFTEKVFENTSNGQWSFDAATKKITFEYKEKAGPQEIQKFSYEIVSITDKELKVKNALNGIGNEYLTFVKK